MAVFDKVSFNIGFRSPHPVPDRHKRTILGTLRDALTLYVVPMSVMSTWTTSLRVSVNPSVPLPSTLSLLTVTLARLSVLFKPSKIVAAPVPVAFFMIVFPA